LVLIGLLLFGIFLFCVLGLEALVVLIVGLLVWAYKFIAGDAKSRADNKDLIMIGLCNKSLTQIS
jgi:tetrahydromethanopterin S-methyltransferase subunit C